MAASLVAENNTWRARWVLGIKPFKFGIHGAGSDENVGITIVIEIDHTGSPTDKSFLVPRPEGLVTSSKFCFSVVVIEPGGLLLKVRFHEVEMTVKIVVAYRNTHAAQQQAVEADSHPAKESFLAEGSIMIVQKKQAGRCVTGDDDILPTVFVGVESHRGKTVGTS